MADDTPLAEDDTMNIGHSFLLVAGHQISFVTVTGDTDDKRTLSPELITVITAMWIMTQGASADHWPMLVFEGKPPFLAGMTGEADFVDAAKREAYLPWLCGLLMAKKTLFVNSGAMPPGSLVDDIPVTDAAGDVFLQASRLNGLRLFKVVAIRAALRQLVAPMEKIYIFAQGLRSNLGLGLYALIIKFKPLSGWNYGKTVLARLKRQPEMQVKSLLPFHGNNRIKRFTGLFNFHPTWCAFS